MLKGGRLEADVIVAKYLGKDILVHLTDDAYRLVKDSYLIMSGITVGQVGDGTSRLSQLDFS